jgi:hypothetical protein
MIIKKVNQYQCEFCGKRGLSASHMTKHEKRCTMNPGRICGMCGMVEQKNDVRELMAILPNPVLMAQNEYEESMDIFHLENVKEIEVVLLKLREVSGNCPACIMAALRQKKIPIPAITAFNFTKECQAFWHEWNEKNNKQLDIGEIW